jgi:hypothetical protein
MLISSPTMDRRATRMSSTPIELVARDAAATVAQRLVEPMRSAVQAAGGSAALAADVQVYDGHLDELVMRHPGARGDVIVGVGGRSRHADEAEELEWGSLDRGPAGWVRTTAARHGRDVMRMWSNELTRELDRRCR